jgi:ABC-2 type transport system permease protein
MSDSTHRAGPPRYHPLWHLTLARVREFLREPEAVFWTYMFPLFLVAALGVAFRGRTVEAFRVAIQDGSGAEAACTSLNGSKQFQASVHDPQEGRLLLRTGRVDLLVVVSGDHPMRYEYFFDPTKPESTLARNAVDDFLQRAAGRHDAVEVRNREIDEPGGRYIDFLVPGLLGMGLMGGGLWGVGFAVVDMRIRKLLKRYLATPMKRSHFMAALIISRLLFTISEVMLLLVFARVIFGVTSQGSYATIGLLILLGSLEFSGIGLLVASRAETIETVSGLMNAVMLPMWIGSGIFFSMERFPAVLQVVLNFLPLTPLIHALRSTMLEGAGIVSLGSDLALIVAWGGAAFILALRWFRWK